MSPARRQFSNAALVGLVLALAIGSGCGGNGSVDRPTEQTQACSARAPQRLEVEVHRRMAHDPKSYTQGLVVVDSAGAGRALFESSGLYGRSKLSKIDLGDGLVTSSVALDKGLFGEGLAVVGGVELVQLTWKESKALRWRVEDFTSSASPFAFFEYEGEGWGLTTLDSDKLLMSDGSDTVVERDPRTFEEIARHKVTRSGGRADLLNEMEWDGKWLWANRYQTNEILRIDTKCWTVSAVVDASALRREVDEMAERSGSDIDVLNGIAFDASTGRYLVTGKLWPTLFEVSFNNVGR